MNAEKPCGPGRDAPAASGHAMPIVHSHDEWSRLEEVIVGRAEDACVPVWHPVLAATMPECHHAWFQKNGGRPIPQELLRAAAHELDGLCALLEREGVVVRRPDRLDWSLPFSTPDFGPTCGLYGAMPRDVLIVIGDEVIEAPMSWRSRYFESFAYRSLLKQYFAQGARWTAAPKPRLQDSFFIDQSQHGGYDVASGRLVISEEEPVFDAADFSRCGRDIFCQLSQVTNRFGIDWLRRHLGPNYRIHVLDFDDPHAMHIDASFVPLRPGCVLINPERMSALPPLLKNWQMLIPPEPTVPASHPFYFSSRWLSLNVLSLDEERVVVEAQERPLISFLKANGFDPIPLPFRNFGSLGGGFHCATCDIRRQGPLRSYL
jgi:glycine amidinotransferase